MNDYFVYIMTNKSNNVIYTGITNNLIRRVFEHKRGYSIGFTKRYKTIKLVYYELFNDINDAIRREKQIKGWRRKKKIYLIESINPNWNDLYNDLSK